MCDKSGEITNICAAEPTMQSPVDVIWPSSDLYHQTCLPIIGSCQVSSILSTIEHVLPKSISNEKIIQPLSNLINEKNDKLDSFKSIPINIIIKNAAATDHEGKSGKTLNKNHILQKKIFEEIIYFGCNLCPFICTKDSKISDHIQSVHKNKNNCEKPQLKCPGCLNIFYHKLSLRSHLIHDHEVGRSDINKIVNSIVYVSVSQENHNVTENLPITEVTVVEEDRKNYSDFLNSSDVQMSDENINNLEESFIRNSPVDSEKSLDEQKSSNLTVHDAYLPKQETNNDIPLIINNDIVQINNEIVNINNNVVNINDTLNMNNDDSMHINSDTLNMNNDSLNMNNDSLNINNDSLNINSDSMNINNDIMNHDIINNDFKHQTNKDLFTKTEETNKKNQKCCISTCAVRMSEISNMAYHVKCHFEKIFRCLECNENFVIWKTLQTHLWRTHNIDMELYSCEKCSYKTYSLAKLNNIHKLIHGNEKSFLCDFCGKGYKNPKQLRNHKIIHKDKTQDKMLHCNICNRSFSDKRMLKVHVDAVHQKLKPFSCNYCSYKAASNGALKLHVRLHTGQKPFVCDMCEYSTGDHNSLRRHKSRHTNEKKYKCIHCDYACIQSSTYKTHLKTKHPGLENNLMFSCTYCQFRSVNKDKYMIHIASHKELNAQKFIDIIENICDNPEGLEERVVELSLKSQTKKPTEFINLKSQIQEEFTEQKLILPKKQLRLEDDIQNMELRLRETPVALISKLDKHITLPSNNFIILPVQSENILNLTNVSDNVLANNNSLQTNNIQYFYNSGNMVLEIMEEKPK